AARRRTHVFRGQARASWDLLPKGLRPIGAGNALYPIYAEAIERFRRLPTTNPLHPSDDSQLLRQSWQAALHHIANEFARLGRSVGLEVPWDLEVSILDQIGHKQIYEPDLNLASLAQHHGIPTTL